MKIKSKIINKTLNVSLLILSSAVQLAHAEPQFNTAFLSMGDQPIDPSSLLAVTRGYDILPGHYQFSIYVNNEQIDNRTIEFIENPSTQSIAPCFRPEYLQDYGIIISPEQQIDASKKTCIDLKNYISSANLNFDAGKQRLDLTIPQVNLEYRPRGYIPNKLIDQGITAAMLNYSLSGSHITKDDNQDFTNFYALLNGGFNYGAWRYRNQSSFISQTNNSSKWQSISNKLERDLIPIQSRLEVGDSYTNSDIFDSFSFRGLQISSDEQQLPYSLQDYAPVVRGVASTNALIEVRQNGYVIYSLNVAPGPFELRDIVSANDSGDLNIRIIESNGQIQEYTQPYSAVPNMLRPGRWKYQLTTGRYRTGNYGNDYEPVLGKATVAYGLNNNFTPYGGLLIAGKHYQSIGTGVGLSLGDIGAFSADVTYAKNELASGGSSDGSSFRFLYSKSLNNFGTNFKVIGYRYSTRGYYDLADSIAERSQWQNGYYEYSYLQPQTQINNLNEEQRRRYVLSENYYNKKNQIQIALSQSLGKLGQVYFNVNNVDYWNADVNQRSWQAGYNTYFNDASVGLYYQNSKSQFSNSDYNVGLNVSIPLGKARSNPRNYTSTSSYTNNRHTGSTLQTGVSGNFLKDRNLQLQVQTSYSEQNNQNLYFNAAYQGSHADMDVGYNYSDKYQYLNGNIRGGILIHSDGVMLARELVSNPILIEAKGAKGVRIENQPGLAISSNGYAVINASSAYKRNRVALLAEDLGSKINVKETIIRDIVPTKDAVIKVKFEVTQGNNLLATLTKANGQPVTIGSIIYDTDNKNLGMVGINGVSYIVSTHSNANLIAKWGDAEHQQCKFNVPELNTQELGYTEANVICE